MSASAQFPSRLFFAIPLALLIATASSCSKPQASASSEPPSVSVAHPVQHQVIEFDEESGFLSSPDMANVVARVSGLVVETSFKEGSLVHQGDTLYVIDDRPFKADMNSKLADVARAQAQLDLGQATLHRLDKVKESRAISEEDYDTAKANVEQAQATLAATKAAVETSQLNLQWTRVTAPITGRVSRQMVQAGNMVNGGSGQNQSTLLTTIVEVDPLYCYVNIPERIAMRFQQIAGAEKKDDIASARIPCFIQLENETGYPHQGVIDFMDNRVDVNTGTIQIRGVIPNANGILNPGSFARMRIPGSTRYTALLIPDAAIGTEQNERFVLILGPDNTAQSRRVKLGALFGSLRSITDGLKPDEIVVTNGLQMARPGAKVSPHETPISQAELDAIDKALPVPTTKPATMPVAISPTTGLQP